MGVCSLIRGDKSKGDLGARGWLDVFLAGSSTAGSVFLPLPTLIHCTISLTDGIMLTNGKTLHEQESQKDAVFLKSCFI